MKEIYFCQNSINDISILSLCKTLLNLTLLDIGYNQLNDIKDLKNCDFKFLEELRLDGNTKINLDVLKACNFPELKTLKIDGVEGKYKDLLTKMFENGVSVEGYKE